MDHQTRLPGLFRFRLEVPSLSRVALMSMLALSGVACTASQSSKQDAAGIVSDAVVQTQPAKQVAQKAIPATVLPPPPPPPPVLIEKTLVLQPGHQTGENTFAIKYGNAPSSGPHFDPNVAELPAGAWTARGEVCIMRSFLRFDELAQIPKGSSVISATLYLTGVSSSLVGPQGNSTYPGSRYSSGTDQQNASVIERLAGDWDPKTLTFDNQPPSVVDGRAPLPPSDTQWNFNAEADVTEMVRAMVADPSGNFGFVIKTNKEAIYRYIVFASCDAKDPASRPKLVIVYK